MRAVVVEQLAHEFVERQAADAVAQPAAGELRGIERGRGCTQRGAARAECRDGSVERLREIVALCGKRGAVDGCNHGQVERAYGVDALGEHRVQIAQVARMLDERETGAVGAACPQRGRHLCRIRGEPVGQARQRGDDVGERQHLRIRAEHRAIAERRAAEPPACLHDIVPVAAHDLRDHRAAELAGRGVGFDFGEFVRNLVLDRTDRGDADARQRREFDVALGLRDQRFELGAERCGAETVEAGVHDGRISPSNVTKRYVTRRRNVNRRNRALPWLTPCRRPWLPVRSASRLRPDARCTRRGST